MHVVMKNNIGQARRLSGFVSDHQLHIKKFHNYSDDEAPFSEIELELTAVSHLDAPEIISELLAVKGIKEADFYADDGQKKPLSGLEDTVYNILLMYTVFCALSYIKMAVSVL